MGQSDSGAFLYDGTLHDLGINGIAYDVNNSGEVTGYYFSSDPVPHAFLYDGTLHDIGTINGAEIQGYGINDAGVVVGDLYPSPGPRTAFYYDGALHTIGTLGGATSDLLQINNDGVMVGKSALLGVPSQEVATYYDGTLHNMGFASPSSAIALNNNGQVLVSVESGALAFESYVYNIHDGTSLHLPTLGGATTEALDINNLNAVVGYSMTTSGAQHAFVAQNGVIRDLNDVVPPPSGWVWTSATAINDLGQIAVVGALGGDPASTHSFLLTPVPEPSTFVLAALSCLLLGLRRPTRRPGGNLRA